MEALVAATRRYRPAKAEYKAAREEAVRAVLEALRAGIEPTTVAEKSPFTPAYIRRLAREADIPPAKPGMKQRVVE